MHLSLRYVTVVNFGSVRNRVSLDFTNTPSGLYYIRGENRRTGRLGSNGAGKSTLFIHPIIWALTGTTPRSKRPGGGIENRQSSGETRVEVEFLLDNNAHIVARTRNPNGLYLDGVKVEQREVDALLPLTDAALRKSILVDQFGEMFLGLRPEAQSQLFTETLNLDIWLKASRIAADGEASASKELHRIEVDKEGTSRARAEAVDQFELAHTNELAFEDQLEVLIAESRARVKSAKATAKQRFDELNEARAANCDSDQLIEINNAKTRLRILREDDNKAINGIALQSRELDRFNKQLKSYSGDISVCPECGQKVGEEHIREKRGLLLSQIKEAERLRKVYHGSTLASEIVGAEQHIVELEALAKEAMAALSATALAAERSLNADREYRRLMDELAELKSRVNPFTKPCNALQARMKELRKELKYFSEREAEASRRAEVARFWVKGFKEIRLEQIDATLAELEMATNRHAESLGLDDWRIAFATDRETQKGTVSYGFTVSLYPPDEPDPVSWETYSGGETQCWQLAATWGLAEVLLARAGISTDFEVIDEPSTHLAPEVVDNMLVCLYDRARELNRRIFLIDHSTLSAGNFDGVVSVVNTKQRGTYIEDTGGVIALEKSKCDRVSL